MTSSGAKSKVYFEFTINIFCNYIFVGILKLSFNKNMILLEDASIPPFIQALGLGAVILNDVGLMAGEDGWRSCPENCHEQVKLAQRPLGEARGGMGSSSIVDWGGWWVSSSHQCVQNTSATRWWFQVFFPFHPYPWVVQPQTRLVHGCVHPWLGRNEGTQFLLASWAVG